MSDATKIIECTLPDGSVVYTNLGCNDDATQSLSLGETDSGIGIPTDVFVNDLEWGELSLLLLIPCIYVGMSLVSFFLYWLDKRKAVRNLWRISEKNLHLSDLLGGWPGAFLAQKAFRHKTQKKEFRVFYWITVVTNIFVFVDWYRGFPLIGQII